MESQKKMSCKLISHRGNLNGPIERRENKVDYIMEAINLGYDVEIDLHYYAGSLYLGHDIKQEYFDVLTFEQAKGKLWIHCKDTKTLGFCISNLVNWNYFFHEEDAATLTSKGYAWLHPNSKSAEFGILVWPEKIDFDITPYQGVCSDFVAHRNIG